MIFFYLYIHHFTVLLMNGLFGLPNRQSLLLSFSVFKKKIVYTITIKRVYCTANRAIGTDPRHRPTTHLFLSVFSYLWNNVNCAGTETALVDCPHDERLYLSCPSGQYASVMCYDNLPSIDGEYNTPSEGSNVAFRRESRPRHLV